MSRIENALSRAEIARMMASLYCASLRRSPSSSLFDIDDPVD